MSEQEWYRGSYAFISYIRDEGFFYLPEHFTDSAAATNSNDLKVIKFPCRSVTLYGDSNQRTARGGFPAERKDLL